MSHRRRPEGAPPPVYGRGSTLFSIEINHGGYFLGTGSNRSYVDGHSIWIDNVDSLTWSTAMLQSIVDDLGYDMAGRIKVHYCIPVLSLSRNGLRQIRDDMDTEAMVTFVQIGNFFMSLYLDHDESVRAMEWDDVVQFPVAELPPVISPVKVAEVAHVPVPEANYIGGRTRVRKRKATCTKHMEAEKDEDMEADNEEEQEAENDSDYDPNGIVDSDFDISAADDDLFEDNVDELDDKMPEIVGSSSQQGKEEACKQEYEDEEDLWAPDSEEDVAHVKVKSFREIDLLDPKFEVGMIFDSVELLRRAITTYSCKNRKDIKLPVNDKRRVKAVCCEDCPWYMWANTTPSPTR